MDDGFTRRHTHIPRDKEKETTHHLSELDGRIAYFIPNPDRNLRIPKQKQKRKACNVSRLPISVRREKMMNRNHSHATGNMKCMRACMCVMEEGGEVVVAGRSWTTARWDQRTSLSNFTLALSPSMASSF